MYTRDSFGLKDRIVGATRHSIILKGDNGEHIYCHNKIFDKIISDPKIQFDIQVLPEHEDCFSHRAFHASKWIVAYLPTRF